MNNQFSGCLIRPQPRSDRSALVVGRKNDGLFSIGELTTRSLGRQCEHDGRAGNRFLILIFNPYCRIASCPLPHVIDGGFAVDNDDVQLRSRRLGVYRREHRLNRNHKRKSDAQCCHAVSPIPLFQCFRVLSPVKQFAHRDARRTGSELVPWTLKPRDFSPLRTPETINSPAIYKHSETNPTFLTAAPGRGIDCPSRAPNAPIRWRYWYGKCCSRKDFTVSFMNSMRRAVCRLGVATLIFIGGGLRGEQAPNAPPKELIQYVRDASALGLKDAAIHQNATKAGWSVATIDEAISYVRSNQQPPEITTAPAQQPAAMPTAGAAAGTPAQRPSTVPENLPPAPGNREAMADGYRIGGGDILQISVWKEPEASVPRAVVRPDGRISLPLLKEVEVLGLTPAEAEKVITTRLAKLIPAADVTVVVTTINSTKIYVVGAVKKEGPIPYTYRMTVMQALSEAGGLSDYAKRKKIYILRTENGKDFRLPFDYDAVLKGERMELNVPLLPNDTLVVPN